jgi:hypothetical protein
MASMRWFVIAVLPAVACTAANPAFDLLDGDDDSAASQEGPDDEGAGDSSGDVDSGVVEDCGPFVESAEVELFVGEMRVCVDYVTTGTLVTATADEIHLRCDSQFDGDCVPDTVSVLRIGYGLPPELVLEYDRPIQLHWITDGNCNFAMVRVQYGDELRESFVALGTPGVLLAELVSYDVEAEMDEACECADCCTVPQGSYLLMRRLPDGVIVSLAEGEEADVGIDALTYRFRNIASNVTGDCRKTFHWQAVRLR